MSWQPEGMPQNYFNNSLHPGMYAADFEQQAFYEQQTHRDEYALGLSFANFNPQEPNVAANMFVHSFPQTMGYFPGMAVHSVPENIASPEVGVAGFNNEAQYFQGQFGVQRGTSRRGNRGGKQEYNGGRQKRNEPISAHSYNLHEYRQDTNHSYPHQRHNYYGSNSYNQDQHEQYSDNSYPHTQNYYGSNAIEGRAHMKGGNRGSNNVRGKRSHGRGEHSASNFRAKGNEMLALERKTNHNLELEQYQQNANGFTEDNNRQSAPFHREVKSEQSNARGKYGKYNSHAGSASFYKGSSQAQDQRTRATGEYPDDRTVNREHFKNERSNTTSSKQSKASDKKHTVGNKSDRPASGFSQQKLNKDNVGPFSKENDENHRDYRTRASGEYPDDRPVREHFKNGRSNTDISKHPRAFDKMQPSGNKNNRPASSFSQRKVDKDVVGPLSMEHDESQRDTLTEQLSSNKYECMVCCDNVHVEDPIWSCKNCYHVFHLPCIKKWAQSSFNQDAGNWRCPGCQNETTYIPSRYFCFCGHRKDPRYKRREIPHSCGDSCRQKRGGDCKHPCTLLCHPGPCPPCSSMVNVTCDCGKSRKNVRCSAILQFKCNQVCDKKLNCQEHKCVLLCHGDSCPPCSVSKSQQCFCAKTKRTVICGTDEYTMISFSCEKPCGRLLGCGNHVCEELCHPGECAPCSLSPSNLQFCSCGKTDIKDLDILERKTCLDPVPTCQKVCNKPMACGSALQPHLCERTCHYGECGPCNKETTLKCECGTTEKKMPCEEAVTFNRINPFKCQKRCGKKRTCGKHKCSETCCVRDIHICELVCGRKLSCGNHKCEELCHKGNCKRCLQASFDELTCYCGVAVIEPPVPCGTRRPECHRPCTRQHDCNHEVRHQCHSEEKCPPCTELTEKMCMGEHTIRKNVPCYQDMVSCGYPCDKRLPCGQHLCLKKCHRGECLEDGVTCTQPCPRPRAACNHPCGEPCHTEECPDTACKTEITISCPCGNRSAKVQCQAGGDLQSNIAQFQRLSVQSMMESGGQSIDMSQFTQMKKLNRRLECDTNCAIIERNKRLALALEIKNPDMSAKLGTPTFSEFLVDFAKKNPKFVSTVEKSFSDLVQKVKQNNQASKTHTFQSMNRVQRQFVHELAESYGCQTQSYDYEPNKNVVATAVRDKCWLPNITLSDHVLKDQMPTRLSSRMGVSLTAMKKEREEVPEKPSGSRAWETTAWRTNSSSGAAASSASSAGAGVTTTKPAAPVIDYFDFEG
ncbi:hypothetical protein EGW08_017144 [Elysia chlorotica]|uniref:Transcriptional repressor NF-X1 n=1 Tax=Elysia chlorotica TaxID=188477 RepID=A0A433T0M1_ELYCH|nr:hypothetical protein EGW08_017144 [Elysia chlorotica]